MPSRNRAREAAKAAAAKPSAGRKQTRKVKKKPKGTARRSGRKAAKAKTDENGSKPKRPRTGPMLDPSAADDAQTRFIQPYEATKTYVCPGCNRDIPPGVGHLVAVPPDEPDLRRHWHRGCWHNRHTRF